MLVFVLLLKPAPHILLAFLLLTVGAEHLEAEPSSPIPVETVVAVPTENLAPELRLTGTVVSQRRSGLSSRAEGLVEEVHVDAGSEVKKGELLMKLDTRLAEIELDLIRAEIEAARILSADAEREWKEVETLTDSGAFSRTEAASREAMNRIRKAELAALKAREEQQLERIERHGLVAPFSGYIVRKATEAGEWVDTGASVFELVATDALWFDIQVAQEFLSQVRGATGAEVVLDAAPGHPLEAKIDVIVPVKDPVSRTFLTRLTFEDPEKQAAPGMSGSAVLSVRPKQSTSITIPRDAVMRYPDGLVKVWTIRDEEGIPVARSLVITADDSLGDAIEVLDGLEGGEVVVIRGNENLEEGQAVAPRSGEEQEDRGNL